MYLRQNSQRKITGKDVISYKIHSQTCDDQVFTAIIQNGYRKNLNIISTLV